MDKNDLISRSEAMEIVKRTNGDYAAAWAEIKRLPAIALEEMRPRGKWRTRPSIKSFKHTNIPVVECSRCGSIFCDIINNQQLIYHYCPHCGAYMWEEDES